MVRETVLRAEDFIAPLFVVDGRPEPEEIKSMPGVFRLNINDLVKAILRSYEKMDMETQKLLPLKKIYWPV